MALLHISSIHHFLYHSPPSVDLCLFVFFASPFPSRFAFPLRYHLYISHSKELRSILHTKQSWAKAIIIRIEFFWNYFYHLVAQVLLLLHAHAFGLGILGIYKFRNACLCMLHMKSPILETPRNPIVPFTNVGPILFKHPSDSYTASKETELCFDAWSSRALFGVVCD